MINFNICVQFTESLRGREDMSYMTMSPRNYIYIQLIYVFFYQNNGETFFMKVSAKLQDVHTDTDRFGVTPQSRRPFLSQSFIIISSRDSIAFLSTNQSLF